VTFRTYVISQYPRWDSWPIALRREYLPKLKRDYTLARSGAVGRAKVRYIHACGFRHHAPSAAFDLAIESLKQEEVLK
jgi:hypothetical protein